MNRPIKIAFLGDSVTEGCFELFPAPYGFETVRRPADGYVEKVANLLRLKYGEHTVEYRNFGKSGLSAHAAEREVSKAVDYAPDIAVVAFGLNDTFHPEERFVPALQRIFQSLAAVPEVIFLTPNMMNTYLHKDTLPEAVKVAEKTMTAQNEGKLDRMVDGARKLCATLGVTVCDAYAQWKELYTSGVDTTALLINCINHPNEEMHTKTAGFLLPFLETDIDKFMSDRPAFQANRKADCP